MLNQPRSEYTFSDHLKMFDNIDRLYSDLQRLKDMKIDIYKKRFRDKSFSEEEILHKFKEDIVENKNKISKAIANIDLPSHLVEPIVSNIRLIHSAQLNPNMNVKEQWLPYAHLANYLEGRNDSEKQADKLSQFFVSFDVGMEYLLNVVKNGSIGSKMFFSKACSFELPENWNHELWLKIIIKNAGDFTLFEMLKIADKVEAKLPDVIRKGNAKNKNITEATITEIKEAYISTLYNRAHEDVEAARLFSKHKVSESIFNRYLELKPNLKSSANIPNITMDLSAISPKLRGYKIYRLDPKKDPICAILGFKTGCCQSLGRGGEMCTVHGMTNDNGGFYVLCDPKGDIKGQTWVWKAKEGNVLTFDSIETPKNIVDALAHETIAHAFGYFAKELVDKCGIERVNVGILGKTPKQSGYTMEGTTVTPLDFPEKGHRDSGEQKVIYDKNHSELGLFSIDPKENINGFEKHLKDYEQRSDFVLMMMSMGTLETTMIKKYTEHIITSSNFDVNKVDSETGEILLHKAIRVYFKPHSTQIDSLNMLIKVGSLIDVKDKMGHTPLRFAVKNGGEDIINLLLDNGANINSISEDETSPLHSAAQSGKANVMRILLGRGAYIEACDKKGRTPLYSAIKKGRIEAIKELIDKGASSEVVDKEGLTPLDYAIQLGDSDIIKMLPKPKLTLTNAAFK